MLTRANAKKFIQRTGSKFILFILDNCDECTKWINHLDKTYTNNRIGVYNLSKNELSKFIKIPQSFFIKLFV